jgi:hypothetical protein
MATIPDFTDYLQSPLRQYARAAIAARRTRLETAPDLADPPPDDLTLDVVEVLHRLCDRVPEAGRLESLLYYVRCARGER